MAINLSFAKKDVLVLPVYTQKKKVVFFQSKSHAALKSELQRELKHYSYEAEENSTHFMRALNQKVLLIGIKKEASLEDLRKYGSLIYSFSQSKKEASIGVELPIMNDDSIQAVIEGIELSDYSFDKYLNEQVKKKKLQIKCSLELSNSYKNLLQNVLVTCKNVKLTRDLVNENADVMTPVMFEKLSRRLAKENKLKIKVLDDKAIAKEKLGLLHAVGKGAINPPRLILIEYNGNSKSKEKIALIGKGITFDTGGINLKPSGYIEDMKSDMGGAATMFGAFKSLVELKVKKNVVLVLACAENSIGSVAYKPGDIFTSYNGTTVEITNTDAEGRLVLADAMSYVQKFYKPTHMIDAATLTGAVLVALGPNLIGMFGNDETMKKKLFDSGEVTQDRVWELPIYDEHREALKSKFSDCVNAVRSRTQGGGSCTAAAFLEKFVEKKTKWVHLDIAGAARSHGATFYVPEFGTGRGVRLLVDYMRK